MVCCDLKRSNICKNIPAQIAKNKVIRCVFISQRALIFFTIIAFSLDSFKK